MEAIKLKLKLQAAAVHVHLTQCAKKKTPKGAKLNLEKFQGQNLCQVCVCGLSVCGLSVFTGESLT